MRAQPRRAIGRTSGCIRMTRSQSGVAHILVRAWSCGRGADCVGRGARPRHRLCGARRAAGRTCMVTRQHGTRTQSGIAGSAAPPPGQLRADGRVGAARPAASHSCGAAHACAGAADQRGARRRPFDAVDATVLLLCADAPEAALRALQRAETAGYRNTGYLRHSPLLQSLRGMPEFAALLARIDADLADQRAQLRRRKLLPPDAISEAAAAI